MKFELIEKETLIDPYTASWILTISKTEFFKSYNKDKSAFLRELNYVLEMYSTPYCFVRQISESGLEDLVKKFKTTYKAVYFDILAKERRSELLIGFLK